MTTSLFIVEQFQSLFLSKTQQHLRLHKKRKMQEKVNDLIAAQRGECSSKRRSHSGSFICDNIRGHLRVSRGELRTIAMIPEASALVQGRPSFRRSGTQKLPTSCGLLEFAVAHTLDTALCKGRSAWPNGLVRSVNSGVSSPSG